jgi:hypothetical protein
LQPWVGVFRRLAKFLTLNHNSIMKKVFFALALVAGIMTAQAQDGTKSKSKDAKKKSRTEQTTIEQKTEETTPATGSGSGTTTETGTGSSTNDSTLTSPAAPVDSTRQDRKPEDNE